MATVFTALSRSLRPQVARRVASSCHASLRACALHTTPVVFKKKPTRGDSDDLFADFGDDSDSLFSAPSKTSPAPPSSSQAAAADGSVTIPRHNPSVSAPGYIDRNVRFQEVFGFLESCILTKTEKVRQVRSTSWQHLFNLATTREQMERVVDLMPLWRDARRVWLTSTATMFARRCYQLHCYDLALEVFGDHSKYGLDLNLTAARITLNALTRNNQPLEDVVAFSALYSAYFLPSVTSDIFSTVYLLHSCVYHGIVAPQSAEGEVTEEAAEKTQDAVALARELVPQLERLLADVPAKEIVQIQLEAASEQPLDSARRRDMRMLSQELHYVMAQLRTAGIEHKGLEAWCEKAMMDVYLPKGRNVQ